MTLHVGLLHFLLLLSKAWLCMLGAAGADDAVLYRFALYEPIEFISTFLQDKLEWRKVKDTVAIHVPCSSKKMGVENAFAKVAGMCAHEVVPSGIPCCGTPPPNTACLVQRRPVTTAVLPMLCPSCPV